MNQFFPVILPRQGKKKTQKSLGIFNENIRYEV